MKTFTDFLKHAYTPYHAVAIAEEILQKGGFVRLDERDEWKLSEGGKYYAVREGSIIAFTYTKDGAFKIAAAHDDSPCLKLKGNADLAADGFVRLNAEPYGAGVYYSLFDRPLKIAGRLVRERDGKLLSELYASDFTVAIPSLAFHLNHEVNEGFRIDEQTQLLPLLSCKGKRLYELLGSPLSYDLWLVPDEEPFFYGADGEFLAAPRLDDLTNAWCALQAIAHRTAGTCVAAIFSDEEIGSRTYGGAASGFLRAVLERIAACKGRELARLLPASVLFSADNAQGFHPNHPEKSDPSNRPVLGGGIAVKVHAEGAYTTNALTEAIVRKVCARAGVPVQTFYNRSGTRSGSTLGTVSLTQAGLPSADIGIAQLAMHCAVETVAAADVAAMEKALSALFTSEVEIGEGCASVK